MNNLKNINIQIYGDGANKETIAKLSQKKWISERPLSDLSFSRVKGIGWLTSLKIVQAYQDSARSCDALDKNNYLRFDPFERESKEAYYDCLLEAKIQLSKEELKDHFDLMEMHYAQHKMSGFKERAIETMRFFEQNL